MPFCLDCSLTYKNMLVAHVQGDLDATIAIAQCLEVYKGGDGANVGEKGSKKFKNQKKGGMA